MQIFKQSGPSAASSAPNIPRETAPETVGESNGGPRSVQESVRNGSRTAFTYEVVDANQDLADK